MHWPAKPATPVDLSMASRFLNPCVHSLGVLCGTCKIRYRTFDVFCLLPMYCPLLVRQRTFPSVAYDLVLLRRPSQDEGSLRRANPSYEPKVVPLLLTPNVKQNLNTNLVAGMCKSKTNSTKLRLPCEKRRSHVQIH